MEFLAGNRIRGLSSEKDTVLVSVTGLKAYYKMEDTSSPCLNNSTSTDSLGTSSDGTVTGGAFDQTGKILKAITLNGSSGYIQLGSSTSQWQFMYSQGVSCTISMWIKQPVILDTQTTVTLFGTYNGSNDGMAVNVNGGSTTANKVFVTYVNSSGGTRYQDTAWDDAYADDLNWHHFVITQDATSAELYVDNVKQATVNNSSTPSGTAVSSPMILGRYPSQNIRYANTTFDEVSIWNRVLSTNEISTLYNSGDGIKIEDTQKIIDGSIFYETDTNKSYVLYNGSWTEL
jgi:hypothetical protein